MTILSQGQFDPNRRMVGRFVAPAHFLVYRNRLQPIGRLRRQKQMVDANAVVLLPRARLIIPERVEAARVGRRAQRVDQAERQELSKPPTRLGQEQRVADPVFWMGGVARLRNDVEIAGENERLLVSDELLRVADEPRP